MEHKVEGNTKSSLKNKIIGYYLALFVFSILVFELFLIYSMKYYYYSTAESMLKNQAKYSQELYETYLSDETLERAILEDRDQFYRHNVSQVQILDNSGLVLLDNIGTNLVGKQIDTEDVVVAKTGKGARAVYKPSYDEKNVMAYSMPLYNRSEQVGIIRLITSLSIIDAVISQRNYIFIFFGLILILVMMVVSYIIANSIVKPINALTVVASKLADGKFNVRSDIKSDDEIGKLSDTINFITETINKKEQLKNDFISSVSHELRTPLTAIQGWATILEDEKDMNVVKDGMHIISKETERLSKMVNELLDFSSYSSGRIDLTLETINIVGLVKEKHKQMLPRANKNNLDIIINYEKEVILGVVDQSKLTQVLINLIDNAIKFTPAGGVVILNVYDVINENIIEVIDTGIGIDSEEISLITGKFYKGKSSNSHTGLGLSISEEIIKAHNGKMIIESKLGEGTKIKIILPKGDLDDE